MELLCPQTSYMLSLLAFLLSVSVLNDLCGQREGLHFRARENRREGPDGSLIACMRAKMMKGTRSQ